MPGHIDLIIFGNTGILRLRKLRSSLFLLSDIRNLAVSYISDKTVFCQYSCPLINLFRFVQHKQFRSFGYFGKDITFDTCFPADRRIFLYCDNILASEGRHNPYTVRFLPVLIRKIRIFLKEIQRHIGITAIRA